jgi:exo-beta-1,3-glucanase (GH17 family)
VKVKLMPISTHDLNLHHAQALADASGEPVKVVLLSERLRTATGTAVAFTRRGWPLEGRTVATVMPAPATLPATEVA